MSIYKSCFFETDLKRREVIDGIEKADGTHICKEGHWVPVDTQDTLNDLMRIDDELFHGTACLIKLTDGEDNYWETPKAGRVQVTGAGMSWLELVSDICWNR